jgi:hypothetical protein
MTMKWLVSHHFNASRRALLAPPCVIITIIIIIIITVHNAAVVDRSRPSSSGAPTWRSTQRPCSSSTRHSW